MRRTGYQVLGFVVWRGLRSYLRRRYPNAPRKLALAGGLVALVIAALLVAGRRADEAG